MRKNRGIVFFMSTVVAGMLLGHSLASAQEAGAARQVQPVRTGVVDMLSLMRAHPKLNADLKAFNAQRMQKAGELMAKERELQEASKVLMQTFGGKTSGADPAFTAQNDALMKKASELDIEKTKAQRELVIADIRMKYEAFKSIREEIHNIAAPRGFAAIMDFRTIDPDADELSNAEVEVTQPIVWCHPQTNLTPYVVNALNKRFSNYPAAAQVDGTGKITFLNNVNPISADNGMGGGAPGPQVPVKPTPGGLGGAQQQQRPATANQGGSIQPRR